MLVATYYAGFKNQEKYSSLEYGKQVDLIIDDFNKLIKFKLMNMNNNERLIEELEYAKLGLRTRYEDESQSGIYNINLADCNNIYSVIEYPSYSDKTKVWTISYIIISSDYSHIIFVRSIDSIQNVYEFSINDEIVESSYINKIDLDWNNSNIINNLNYLRNNEVLKKELPKFIFSSKDHIDELYNYSLACNYANAMRQEDFARLGNIDATFLKNISKYISYNADENFIKNIPTGNIMTYFNRTFYEAVVLRNLGDVAVSLIENGCTHYKVYLTGARYSKLSENLVKINKYLKEDNKFDFLNNLFNEIDIIYKDLNDEEQKEFIEKIKSSFINLDCFDEMIQFDQYEWMKLIITPSLVRKK